MNRKPTNDENLSPNDWTKYLDSIQVEASSLNDDSSGVIVSESEVADVNISRILSSVEDSADRMLDALEQLSDMEQNNLLETLGQRRLSSDEFNLICGPYMGSEPEPDLTPESNSRIEKDTKNPVKFELIQNLEFDSTVSTDDDNDGGENNARHRSTEAFMGSSINTAACPVIKLIGVGGGGSNTVQHMVSSGIEGVNYICANTDVQALKSMQADTVLHIGQSITKGLGAGANPKVGRQAAIEDREGIERLIKGTDLLFITAGMGGGTGTGAAPVVAQIAQEMGVLTVAVVTKPFPFEGSKRMKIAESGIDELRNHVDSLITIPNEKLLSVLGKNISLLDAFRAANDVLRGAVQGIANLITNPGLINVDFADVRTVMSGMGAAMMGSGIGRGSERAVDAAEMAISSPLLEEIDLASARGILVNITAGLDMAIGELEEVGNVVRRYAAHDATIVVGTAIDESLEDELHVTVVATGLSRLGSSAAKRALSKQGMVAAGGMRLPHLSVAASGSGHVRRASQHGSYLDIPAFLRRQAD